MTTRPSIDANPLRFRPARTVRVLSFKSQASTDTSGRTARNGHGIVVERKAPPQGMAEGPAGLQTKLANPDGHAVGKLSTVFGEEPTNALLSELDKVKGFQATNNLALSGSKTAMASSADEFMPTAKTMGGETGGHGVLGSLPPWAVGIGGGALAGREVGEVFGQPQWVWRLAQLEAQRAPLRLHSSTPAGWRRRGQTAQLKRGC